MGEQDENREAMIEKIATALDVPRSLIAGVPSSAKLWSAPLDENGEPTGGWSQVPIAGFSISAISDEDVSGAPCLSLGAAIAVESAGRRAGHADEPKSACPYDVGSLAEKRWTRGWIDGRGIFLQERGQFDHTPEFYADLAEPARSDPVVEILGGYDDADVVAFVPAKTFEPWRPFDEPSTPTRSTVRFAGRSVDVADPNDPALEFDAAFDRLVVALSREVEPLVEAFVKLAKSAGDAGVAFTELVRSPVAEARRLREKNLIAVRAREAVAKAGREKKPAGSR